MKDFLLMTPGPTYVSERVRQAISKPITNPDLDEEFFTFYDGLCAKLGKLLNTKEDVLVLCGEGILGLEASVASLVEPGDKVLCVANGVFGEGFGEFVEMYGGVPVYIKKEYNEPVTKKDLEDALNKNPDVKIATVVHCETPAGLINPIEEICPYLHEREIITIVDAVSSIGGIRINTDEWGIDVILGGSQKCLSAPPGLSFLSLSKKAWEKIKNRKTPIRGYYLNLLLWQEMWKKKRIFPYTQPVSDIYGLNEAVKIALEDGEDIYRRHKKIGKAVRETLKQAGFQIYPLEGFESDTVTAFNIPEGIDDEKFRRHLLKKYGVMIAGSWGKLSGRVWRIGHMGENAREDRVFKFFTEFQKALQDFHRDINGKKLSEIFAGTL
ncbi:pyridoxal-phosphate-dependent aminotransferase family protein [Thermovenabulum sp.]|uniref:pyridoxal-phosphate-dependent aminotransferase family protein n=1 Tax=Thermovenabulum sp. TaxID=3100335 RepID=UPI003C7E59F6